MYADNRDIIEQSAQAVLVFYDCTRPETLTEASDQLKALADYLDFTKVPAALVATKCDLVDKQVTVEQARLVQSAINGLGFFETSAKEN